MTLFCPQEFFHHSIVPGQLQLVFEDLSCPQHSRHLLVATWYREVKQVTDSRRFSPKSPVPWTTLCLPSPSATVRNITSQPPACEEIVHVCETIWICCESLAFFSLFCQLWMRKGELASEQAGERRRLFWRGSQGGVKRDRQD